MSIRSDPFETMERMFEQMRRSGLREDPFGSLGRPGGFDANVTLERDDDGYVVMADLPGYERDELDLTYADGALTISGVHEDGEGEGYRSRSVTETVTIPEEVDAEAIEATYRNGVLEVTLPVVADSSTHHIDIN